MRGDRRDPLTFLPVRPAASATNALASGRISSRRCRSGGTPISTTRSSSVRFDGRRTIDSMSEYLELSHRLFGLKPTIRIGHVTIRETPKDTVVASKLASG